MNKASFPPPLPDFRALFESAPGCYLVLLPDLTITAVSDAYLHATMTQRSLITGRGIFEVFPDNPDDPAATGVSNLRASLQRVLANKTLDTMAVQKYDIRQPADQGGGFEERYWSPVNSPVFGPDDEVAYIIHRVEDVTEFVRLKQRGAEQHQITEDLRRRGDEMEIEILRRAQELQAVNKRLRDNQIFLDSIIENLPSMVFVKEAKDLRFVYFNKAGEQLLGYPRSELIGKNDYAFFPKAQADFFVEKDRSVLRDGQLLEIPEEPILTRHHGERTLCTRKIPIADSDGQPIYLLGVSEDITEQKKAEAEIRLLNARLEQHIRDLEAANEELDSFANSVSHDLRAPLRGINGYAKILREDYAELSEAERLGYLQKIEKVASRMGLLIDGLLNLSRVARHELRREPVDLSEIARTILRDLEESHPGHSVAVGIENGLMATGDAVLLHDVLQNLLHNAWKFSSKARQPRIEVGSLDRGPRDGTAYFVRDNGVGFNMEYQDKLFGAFQRLHTEREFEGTGIGLATVRRILRRHGGRIWAEAEEGKGATFYFTLE